MTAKTASICSVLLLMTSFAAGQPLQDHRKLKPVYFTDVRIEDQLIRSRIEANQKVSIAHNLDWCEHKTGRIANFVKAATRKEGGFSGIYFDDSDVYKVIEGASYSLAQQPDPALERRLDDWIAKIAAAQHEDGYLNTYYTIKEPGKRWTNLGAMHELYCAGHLIEAAVAHHRATGKNTLLEVARRFADHIDSVFGPDKRHDVCGHEEIELALIKLHHLTGEARYYKLAQFFLDMRGNAEARKSLYGEYCQDLLPVRRQREIGGHAVRAMYLYSAVADAAALTRDEGFIAAMDSVWKDVALKKMYITGGIGPSAHNEGFTVAYDLPNESAYAETCASIGMALWNHRLNLLHADARYFDVVERALYNGLLSGVNLAGDKFFYVNPLASKGRHHRQSWFGCACCPSNMVRFIPSIPGYVYAVDESAGALYVNLFVASQAKIKLPAGSFSVTQQTRYPWEGRVRIVVAPAGAVSGASHAMVRIPGWAAEARLLVNDKPMDRPAIEQGYARVALAADGPTTIDLQLPMTPQRVRCNPLARANIGRIAVQRGPVVYCLEGADHPGVNLDAVVLSDAAKLTDEFRADLLGGVSVVKARATLADAAPWRGSLYRVADDKAVELTMVPYFAWDNRAAGQMAVWLASDPTIAVRMAPPTPAGAARVSASHCFENDALAAVNDAQEPKSSDDGSIPRMTWWPRKGSTEWLQYDFDAPTSVSGAEAYFFQDSAGCRLPQSWKLLYRDGETWKEVPGAKAWNVQGKPGFPVDADRFNKVVFNTVKTRALRLEVQLRPNYSGGILEWRIAE